MSWELPTVHLAEAEEELQSPPSLHSIKDSDEGGGALYALLPDDGTNGLLIGERADVEAVGNVITRFLVYGQAGEAIPDVHPQLGTPWLSAREAEEKWGVPRATITLACRRGKIREARKLGNRWQFPQRTFLAWLHRREEGEGSDEPEAFDLLAWADELENTAGWYDAELAKSLATHGAGTPAQQDKLAQLLDKHPEKCGGLAAMFPEAVLAHGRAILCGENAREILRWNILQSRSVC